MKIIILKSLLVLLSYLIAILGAVHFGLLYEYFFPRAVGGGWIGAENTLLWLAGYPLAVIFLLTLLMRLYGGKHAWAWALLGASPAILFEIVFDPSRIYFPIILAVIAWFIGAVGNKVLSKLTPNLMARLK